MVPSAAEEATAFSPSDRGISAKPPRSTLTEAGHTPALLERDVARFGYAEAAFLARMRKWILFNQRRGTHAYDGRTWTYDSQEVLAQELFLTKNQLRRVTKHLIEAGEIEARHLSPQRSDRRLWYAFVDEAKSMRHTWSAEDHTPPVEKPTSSITTRDASRVTTTTPPVVAMPVSEAPLPEKPEASTTPYEDAFLFFMGTDLGPISRGDVRPDERGVAETASVGEKVEELSNVIPIRGAAPGVPAACAASAEPRRDAVARMRPVYPDEGRVENPSEVDVSTSDRLKAFQAVRGNKGTDTETRYTEREDRRGDVTRRQDRDLRAGKPRSGRGGGKGPPRAKAPLQSPVWAAWREAMRTAGFPAVNVPERRDVEDGLAIIEKAGGEAEAIAYVTWVVEHWQEVLQKFPRIEEYGGRAFHLLAGGWMRSLFPFAQDRLGANARSPLATGSEAFRRYMALTPEEMAKTDPRKFGEMETTEILKAIDAKSDAEEMLWKRSREGKQ